MNASSLATPNKTSGIYALLRDHAEWDAWQLSQAARTTCISTHIAAINHQLAAHGKPERVHHRQQGRKHFYRLEVAA